MFKRIRIAVLLYVLAFVAAGTYLAERRSTDWIEPLWVNVYAAPAHSVPPALATEDLAAMEEFLAAQARGYGVPLERPFRLHSAGAVEEPLPRLPEHGSRLDAIVWSLAMRWRVIELDWASEAPTPDIVLFVVAHPEDGAPVERSAALRKGLVAVANIIDAPAARGSNRVVMAHELLHTLGASDKYDPATSRPLHPHGYADPDRAPLHPQRRAELMGGRIALSALEAAVPGGLDDVVIGPLTAVEIGWLADGAAARQQQ